jgi:hypothetical protein
MVLLPTLPLAAGFKDCSSWSLIASSRAIHDASDALSYTFLILMHLQCLVAPAWMMMMMIAQTQSEGGPRAYDSRMPYLWHLMFEAQPSTAAFSSAVRCSLDWTHPGVPHPQHCPLRLLRVFLSPNFARSRQKKEQAAEGTAAARVRWAAGPAGGRSLAGGRSCPSQRAVRRLWHAPHRGQVLHEPGESLFGALDLGTGCAWDLDAQPGCSDRTWSIFVVHQVSLSCDVGTARNQESDAIQSCTCFDAISLKD